MNSLSSLTPPEQQILELLSVFYAPIKRTRFLQALDGGPGSSHQPSLFGKETRATLRDLEDRGLVVRLKDRVVCRKDLREPLTRKAHGEGRFPQLARAVTRVTQPSTWSRPPMNTAEQGLRELRLALFEGAFETAQHLVHECTQRFPASFDGAHPYRNILENPYDEAWLASLPPEFVSELLSQLLSEAFFKLAAGEPYIDFLESYVADGGAPPQLKYFLATQQLWRGVPEEVERLYPNPEEGVRAATAHGWLAFVRGDDRQAIAYYEAALTLLRKETRKRNVRLGTVGELFFGLALLRSGGPDAWDRLVKHFSPLAQSRSAGLAGVYAGICRLACLRAGRTQEARQWPPPLGEPERFENLYGLLRGLLSYWENGAKAALGTRSLEAFCSRALEGGYLWLALEGVELLARMDPSKKEYADQAGALRREMGVVPLCDVLAPEAPWQPVLRALTGLRGKAGGAQKGGQPEWRLTWRLRFWSNQVELEPRQQKRTKQGGWTKGRSVALKRLAQDPDGVEGLTDQDRAVLRSIHESHSYRSYGYYGNTRFDLDGPKALTALVGHPLVFRSDDPSTRVEVVRGEPQLQAVRKGRKIHLSLEPPLGDHPGPLVYEESPSRVRVIEVRDDHRRLSEILGKGVTVPATEEEQVRRAVAAVAQLVTVQSDVGGAGENAEEVAPDPRPRIQLRPEGDAYRAHLVVRPLGDDGPAFLPGEGGSTIVAEVGGTRRHTRRDLELEHRGADEVVEHCDALSGPEPDRREWLLEDAEACLGFLSELHELGDAVVLEWPEGQSLSVSARPDLAQLRLKVRVKGDWFAASGTLEVDEGRVLELGDLLDRMRDRSSRFVPLGENRFIALTRGLQRRLQELDAFGERKGKALRLHPLSAATIDELAGDVGGFKVDGDWAAQVKKMREAEQLDPPVPSTLQAELREYQHDGYRWLRRLAHLGAGACLADDMGLGKTVQALAAILARAPDGPTLVVAPTSVCMNWVDEARRFAPTLRPVAFADGVRTQIVDEAGPFDLVICSYGLLHLEEDLLTRVHWQTVVLDEAQAIKNTATKRSRAAMKLQAGFRIITTGTPVENHLGELWNLFRFLNPGLLGSLKRFNERFAVPIEGAGDRSARDRLKRLVGPFLLRRIKSEVLEELPPRSDVLVHVDLSTDERALYEALRRAAVERASRSEGPAGQQHMTLLAEIMKLRRACCHPRLVARDTKVSGSKLETFAAIVEDLRANRHKALVFSQFVDHLSVVREHLDTLGIVYQYLDGSTPTRQRRKRVAAFQAGEGDLFLISLKAGGTGLNLTAADYVIHLDPWWNPAVEDQASDRAHRIGQTRPVTVYRLVARDTIEDKIVDLHRRKRELADGILEGTESTRLSLDDLVSLLKEG